MSEPELFNPDPTGMTQYRARQADPEFDPPPDDECYMPPRRFMLTPEECAIGLERVAAMRDLIAKSQAARSWSRKRNAEDRQSTQR